VALIVRRTKGTSPAFIKELVRRSAQFQIELGAGSVLKQEAVDEAIEEMVFTGGALQFKAAGRLGNRTRGCGSRVTLQVLLSNKLGPAFRPSAPLTRPVSYGTLLESGRARIYHLAVVKETARIQ